MKKILFCGAALCLLLAACKNNSLNVDISSVEIVPLQTNRLEQDLFSITASNFDQKTTDLKEKYGPFYEHYLMNPLRLNGTADTAYKPLLLDFINNREIKDAYSAAQKLYPASEIEKLEPELNNMVKRFKYHFPGRELPSKFITCTTGWNYAVAYIDGALVTSLDMYLGDTSVFYKMLNYPQYQTRHMNKHYILPDLARGWLLTSFDNNQAQNNLLSHTIFYGKLYYAVNALLPDINDSLLIGYTTKQMQTCNTYEKNYWSYFAEKNRLYENNLNTIRELIMPNDGPFTAAISKECPPRIGMWLGLQIVRSYMKNNENVTLDELMKETDAQKILSKSKYRP
ncbi:MAG: hypothetical protein JNL60_08215 [Bacteroidia bacterium]|nr:hypothetical protein [Bacteroidia bacterium]